MSKKSYVGLIQLLLLNEWWGSHVRLSSRLEMVKDRDVVTAEHKPLLVGDMVCQITLLLMMT